MIEIAKLQKAHAEIEISVKEGLKVDSKVSGNGLGILLAIITMLKTISEEGNIEIEKVMEELKTVLEITNCINCESKNKGML